MKTKSQGFGIINFFLKLLAQFREKVDLLEKENREVRNKLENTEEKLAIQSAQLQQLLREKFGKKSERFVSAPGQLALDLGSAGERVELEEEASGEKEEISYSRKKGKKVRTNWERFTIPEGLPEVIVELEPLEDVKGWKKIGEEVTRELDYEVGYFYTRKYVRYKYVKPEEKDAINSTIVVAPMPSRPIDKGMPGAGLLSYIMVSKYVDHLPLDRLLKMFSRNGISIKSSTLNGWVKRGANLLEAIYEQICKHQFSKSYLMADETTIKVVLASKAARNNNGVGKLHQGYFWAYYDPLGKNIVFIYEKGRASEYPKAHLKDFSGKLQTDAYAGYNFVNEIAAIILFACMAHVRRKFEEARKKTPEIATIILTMIQQLYAIERKAREEGMSAAQRLELRQLKAKPIMEKLKTYLLDQATQVIPKSSIAKAINYALNRWIYLERYLSNGEVEIDNNLIENMFRAVAVGRKNYLFCGSENGARWAAILYTILGCAKLHGLNPHEYLRDVLIRLPDTKRSQLHTLIPQNWKKQADLYPPPKC